MGKKILFVSNGEYGDAYGAGLAAALKDITPAITVTSIVGTGRTGSDATGGLNRALESGEVDCVVLADVSSPDLRFIKKIKNAGLPVIHYARTHAGPLNVKQIKKLTGLIDRVLAVYPFEAPLYEEAGVDVEFVGHPLVDIVDCSMSRDEAKAALGYDRTEVPVTLIPGGANDEANRLLKVMVDGAAEAAEASTLKVKLIIPDAERYGEEFLKELIKISPRRLKVLQGQRHIALRASEGAVIAAGTATIEAALAGVPMLILQKTSALTYLFARMRGGDGFIGLPNIILDKPLCPELVQKDVTPLKITQEVMELMEGSTMDGTTKDAVERGLAEVREKLGPPGSLKRAAEAICRVIKK